MAATRLLLGGFMLVAALPVNAGEPLMMRVTPAMALAPAFLTVATTIESDRDNRAVEVVVESPEFYTSSRLSLDGSRAPRANIFTFRDLPSGKYEVTATLIGSRGKRAATSGWFRAGASPGR